MHRCDIGIVGGGQLGKMLVEAAEKLGRRSIVWADKDDSPALDAAYVALKGPYTDPQFAEVFASLAPVAVAETEHIPVSTWGLLARLGTEVSPTPTMLRCAGDRLLEKDLAKKLGIDAVEYRHVFGLGCCGADSIRRRELEPLLPGYLKTRKGGYDGQRQKRMESWRELIDALALLGNVPCILEREVAYECELSQIGVRDRRGCRVFYPLVKNLHKNGILVETTYEPKLFSEAIAEEARSATWKLMDAMDHWGILAVEFFLTKDGRLLFNEMAPRPHNSGHWTIEGCRTSQFAQLVRVAAGMGLEHIEPTGDRVVMRNLFGEEVLDISHYLDDGWQGHIYGKKNLAPRRKTGHVTRVYPSQK